MEELRKKAEQLSKKAGMLYMLEVIANDRLFDPDEDITEEELNAIELRLETAVGGRVAVCNLYINDIEIEPMERCGINDVLGFIRENAPTIIARVASDVAADAAYVARQCMEQMKKSIIQREMEKAREQSNEDQLERIIEEAREMLMEAAAAARGDEDSLNGLIRLKMSWGSGNDGPLWKLYLGPIELGEFREPSKERLFEYFRERAADIMERIAQWMREEVKWLERMERERSNAF